MERKVYKDKLKSTKNIRKVFSSLLPVQAFAMGLPSINLLVSSFIIGNFFGSNGLAAIGFAGPFVTFVTAFAATISMGSQLLCGQSIGKGDKKEISTVFSTTYALCVACGLLLTFLSLSFSGPITKLLGASEETFEMTRSYILGQAPGLVFTVLSSSIIPFLQLDQAKKVSTVSIAVMVAFNVGFNFLNAIVLNMGLYGVGLSTALANTISALIGSIYLFTRSKTFKFSIKNIKIPFIGHIFKLGAPTAVSNICMVFRDRTFNSVLFGLGGTMAVSAATLAVNISNSIGGTIQGGYSGTANLLSSVLVGERDVDSLRKLPKALIRGIFWIYLIAYILIFAFARPVALTFGADPDSIGLFVMAIRLYCCWFITNSFKVPSLSIYWAMGKVKLVSFFYMMNDLIEPLFCYFILAGLAANISTTFALGIVYASSGIIECLTVVSYIVYYTVQMKELPKSLFKITYIPRDFSVPKEDTLSATVQTREEAVILSQSVIEFCKSKGMSSRDSYYSGLAVEEMIVDTIVNGIKKDKNIDPVTVDVRIFYENNEISIMLRDDCEEFNPEEWLELHAPEDPSRSLGIKMVSSVAKEMNHQSALGLNVLYMKMENKAA